jgi:3-oxoacyl-[acyl-carrier protein] reductase
MSTSPPERIALVTGASGGIGAAVARRLAADGMTIAVHYAGNPDRAQATVDAVGGRAAAFRADIGEPDEVAALFDQVEETFGGVDVVVNSAGIMLLSPLAETELETFDRMVRTNLRGHFLVAQQAVRRLREGGAFVGFTSSVVELSLETYAAYAATKGGVEAMTMVMAKELRGRDVTANTVGPGPTATPLFLDGKPQEVVDAMAKRPPLERLGQPEDIAEVVAFLAGPGRWVDGQVIYVNGGIA